MILSLSGTHGSGKTTILTSLENMGYNVIPRKSSRSVLEDWNINLEKIYNDPILMMKFQDEIFKRKLNDEKEYVKSSEIWFTDRSYVDLLVYSSIILGHNIEYSTWLDDYYMKCKKIQNLYELVFYISPLPFINSDGVRNTNVVFNAIVDYSILGFLNRLNLSSLVKINSSHHENRLKNILHEIKTLKNFSNYE